MTLYDYEYLVQNTLYIIIYNIIAKKYKQSMI